MKIAFCVLKNLAFCGGIERYTLELGSRLARRGHDVCVYSMRHYGPTVSPVEGMRVIGVPCLSLRPAEKLTAGAAASLRMLLDAPSDVVHFQHVSSGWAGWLSAWRGHRRVLQSHGLAWRSRQWGRSGSTFLRLLERLSLRQCDVLTGVSRTQCEYYLRRYGVPMEYIPAGAVAKEKVGPHEIRRLGLGSDPYVLYVGRLSPEKGVHTLVSAFGRMGGRRRLVLAGPVCDRRYAERLKNLAGGDDRVLLAGAVKGRMLGELFSNAAVYVQPSQLEGLSMALLEAMSYGCCCLVSDIPENLEAIGPAGRSFPCDDAEGLRRRLACLLDSPDEAHVLGTMARRRVIECYDWEKITSQFEDLYRGLPISRTA